LWCIRILEALTALRVALVTQVRGGNKGPHGRGVLLGIGTGGVKVHVHVLKVGLVVQGMLLHVVCRDEVKLGQAAGAS
jgi:hypothetical protein